jgi:hypothetical protein
MELRTLRRYPQSRGELVLIWKEYLRGLNIFKGVANKTYDDEIWKATKKYQGDNNLGVDGVVGNTTWGYAMAHGLELVLSEQPDHAINGPNWPPKPDFPPLNTQSRIQVFGRIPFKASGTSRNPEAITILGGWTGKNLIKVEVPQLKGIPGAPKSGKIFWNKKAVPQLLWLFAMWEVEGLMPLVESWAGSWSARFVRGSKTTLSNHSWATAFDINVPWNGLRQRPALVGEKGSVRELVPAANAAGFFWGGHFSRKDGMHFEVAKILSEDELIP